MEGEQLTCIPYPPAEVQPWKAQWRGGGRENVFTTLKISGPPERERIGTFSSRQSQRSSLLECPRGKRQLEGSTTAAARQFQVSSYPKASRWGLHSSLSSRSRCSLFQPVQNGTLRNHPMLSLQTVTCMCESVCNTTYLLKLQVAV